jgi:DNA polymerase III subunit delta'
MSAARILSFDRVFGQESAVTSLKRAIAGGRLHHAYRFEGPAGVGKELAAFALAQALLCETGTGCGQCSSCRRAERPVDGPSEHPDLMIIERGLYRPEMLGRKRPELKEISVDQIRTMVLPHTPYPPHEGRARVFLFRRADELSVSAANALLKTLEEPRQSVHFILLTSRPDRLLTTIRSRTMPIRFAPLADSVMREILGPRGVPSERIDEVVSLASGSVESALLSLDPERADHRRAFIDGMWNAVLGRRFADSITFAEATEKDRGSLRELLDAFASALSRRGRAIVTESPDAAERFARAHTRVTRATLDLEESNASTNLLLIDLCADLRRLALPPST